MTSPRILNASLALAALLFGNVAGWVHVGCSSHHATCCKGHTIGLKVANAAGHHHSGHSCCHHVDSKQCETDQSADQRVLETLDPEHTKSEKPADQHDSDRCSICQNFFASRQAVVLWETVAAADPVATSRDIGPVDDALVCESVTSHHWVRGPPRA